MVSFWLAIVVGVLWLFCSSAVANLAERKGHSAILWYLFALFFSPLLAFVIVASLPSEANLEAVAHPKCHHCSRVVPAESEVCPHCGADLAAEGKARKIAA